MAGSAADQASACVVAHGHAFQKKTFHKPTYCHHCGDMLWGLIQQGFVCEGPNASKSNRLPAHEQLEHY
ncbi:hypothetical protein YQE_08917, partial [Dendroctonus ponderosae]